MAELATLARPYAKAAFELAKSANRLNEWSRALNQLTGLVGAPELREYIGSPVVADVQKAYILFQLFDESPGEEIRRFINVLAENQRLELIPEITENFEQRRADEEKVLEVELISAVELTSAETTTFEDALSKRFARDITLTQTVDTEIVGGVIIRAGDTVLDNSLRGKLNKMQEALRRA